VVLGLVVYLLLSILGTAIGAGSIDPLKDQKPVSGLGTGTAIWLILTSALSVAVGAFASGRLARREGRTHGLLAWAVTTLVTFYLLASAVSGATGSILHLAGSGLSAAGSGIAAVAPAAGCKVEDLLAKQGITLNLDNIGKEMDTTLRQTGKAELNPDRLKADAKATGADALQATQTGGERPQAADDELPSLWSRILAKGSDKLDAADRDALVNVVAARTGKSKDEASQIVAHYEQLYNDAMAKYGQAKLAAIQKAREAADATARAVSQAAWLLLVMLVIGVVIAAIAGSVGAGSAVRRV
jgi:ElaB/YqjD/DUF883 family membrane-anchored ribosome-binding protein